MRSLTAILATIAMLLAACGGTQETSADADRITQLEDEVDALEADRDRLTTELDQLGEVLFDESALETVVLNRPAEVVASSESLSEALNRGSLNCGSNANAPGFAFLDPQTNRYTGFDIDFCRAIAAAVFGERGADRLTVTPLSSTARFAALQDGSIDVLIRNTTWTLSRDAGLGVDFVTTTFYDGQGLVVRSNSGIQTFSDLADRRVCVGEGSTSAANMESYLSARGIDAELVVIRAGDDGWTAYVAGACDAFTSDKSGLAGDVAEFGEPGEHVILAETISREPLGPVVRQGDDAWNDVVRWVVQCMLNGEHLGVGQNTISKFADTDDVEIQRLLGHTGDLGQTIGLPADFCAQVITQVGNYSNVYLRHFGPLSRVSIPRGVNSLFDTDEGILYPLPFK